VFLHLDNAPMLSVKLKQEFLRKRGVQVLEHTPYSHNLAPVHFSLFPKLYKEPMGVTMTPKEYRKEWGRLLRRIPKEEFIRVSLR
jgi:hypothetical protein